MLQEIKWYNLVYKEYVIKDKKIYKGRFVQYKPKRIMTGDHELCIGWYMVFSINNESIYFDEDCIYYDPKEYYQYHAKVAQESMELRALNKILKNVVNEEFGW
uniref:Uncharacterized protein n=1 Tax=viral metagenome TaxID=1070528 RepID=A0A6C0D2K6_9ZZZZ